MAKLKQRPKSLKQRPAAHGGPFGGPNTTKPSIPPNQGGGGPVRG